MAELPPLRRVAEPIRSAQGPALVAGPSRLAKGAYSGVGSGAMARLRRRGARPWDLAFEAALAAGVELRPLAELEDADRILRVMNATWAGPEFPREVLRALAQGTCRTARSTATRRSGTSWGGSGWIRGRAAHALAHARCPARSASGGWLRAQARTARAGARPGDRRGPVDLRSLLIARNGYFNLHKLGAVADRFDRPLRCDGRRGECR